MDPTMDRYQGRSDEEDENVFGGLDRERAGVRLGLIGASRNSKYRCSYFHVVRVRKLVSGTAPTPMIIM